MLLPLYACQSPLKAFFVQARRFHADDNVRELEGALELSSNNLDFDMVWRIRDGFGLNHEDVALEWGPESLISVVPFVTFAGQYAVSRASGIPFDEFTMGMLTCPPGGSDGRRDRVIVPRHIRDIILDEYPWFTRADLDAVFNGRGGLGSGGGDHGAGHGGGGHGPAPAAALDEEEALDAVAELREFRDAWKWDSAGAWANFYIFDRGGRRTKRIKGVASDCVAVLARRHAGPWCRDYRGQKMRSFSFEEHTVRFAHVLAQEWVMKSEHYYKAWQDAGAPTAYDFHGVPPYQHSDAFQEALEEVPAGSTTFHRFHELVDWQPVARVP